MSVDGFDDFLGKHYPKIPVVAYTLKSLVLPEKISFSQTSQYIFAKT